MKRWGLGDETIDICACGATRVDRLHHAEERAVCWTVRQKGSDREMQQVTERLLSESHESLQGSVPSLGE